MLNKFLLTTAAILTVAAAPAMAENHMDGDHSAKAEKTMDAPNIVEIATSDDNFSTLTAALTQADLVETLQNAENVTVFAPTNEAFAKLPEGTVENLLKPENKEALKSVLTYHVVPSKVMSADIAEGTTMVETMQGDTVEVVKDANGVTVDDAMVTTADVKANNGVIHVIDTVIMPAAE